MALSDDWDVQRGDDFDYYRRRQPPFGSALIPTAQYRQAMRNIAAEKGDFVLFGIFKRAICTQRWDLVVAAPWLEAGTLESFETLRRLVSQEFPAGTIGLPWVGRVVTLDPKDPGVVELASTYSLDDGEIRVPHSYIFDMEMDGAIILRAKSAA
jgi:hypothetical protein